MSRGSPGRRVALVAPSVRGMRLPPVMRKIQSGLGVLPPLGLLYLASYVKGECRVPVSVLDGNLLGLDAERVARWAAAEGASIVGVSALTLNMPEVLRIARAVKALSPGCAVVVGGPHATLFPEETIGLPGIDYVVRGEGEVPFSALVARLAEGGSGAAGLPGVLDRAGGEVPPPFTVDDLDALPFPARDAVPFARYRTVVSKRPPVTALFSSRGCPHGCIFCHTAGGKRVRSRSAGAVVAEVVACRDLGVREVFFFDESFAHDRARTVELCEGLIEAGVPLPWEARARVDCVDDELLRLMARAGCRRLQYGVESGVQKVLDLLGKGITLQQALDAFRLTRRAGISTYGDFMIGCPGEGPEEVEETLRFARALEADHAHFSVLIPYPRTKLYAMAQQKGIVKGDPWRAFAESPEGEFELPYYTECFTRRQLEGLLRRAWRSFYLRPSYVAGAIGALRSPGELARKAAAALRLFAGG